MKKKILLILSFVIPFIIYFLFFYYKELFNDKTILDSDAAAQYFPLFHYLKDVFNGNASIFYNMSKGLGGTMYGTIFYYLSSPFNLLMVFANENNIELFMLILILIKLSLCGLTMYIYMSNKFNQNNFKILIFSLAYAFMGYNLNYFINIMWLDGVLLAPLILLGIDKIINDKSPILYIITLFIAIFSNYYIAYMICLFAVIYFLYEVLLKYDWKENKNEIKKLSVKFISISLLTGLMCSFFIFPSFLEILNTSRKHDSIKMISVNYFNIFAKSFIGSSNLNDPLNYDSINIYCGIIMLPLTFLFITNKTINKKERILTLLLILSFILPVFFPLLNCIWHIFTYPNAFNYRYSFLTCLFMIYISYKVLNVADFNKQNVLAYLIFYLLLSISFLYILETNYYNFLDYKKLFITVIILIINCLILIYIKNKAIKQLIICIFLLIELILNLFLTFEPRTFVHNNISEMSLKIELFKQKCKKNYRCENTIMETLNDSLLKDYNGIATFLSTTNKRTTLLYNKILNDKSIFLAFLYKYNDIVIDSLLGAKTVGSNTLSKYYNIISTFDYNNETYYILDNPLALKIGYMINTYSNNFSDDENTYGPEYQNKLINAMLGYQESYYSKLNLINIEKNTYQVDLTNTDSEYLYLKLNNKPKDLYINNKKIESFVYSNNNYIVIDNIYNGTVEIKFDGLDKFENLEIYSFNYELFKKAINELQKNQLDIEKNTGNYIKGQINVTDNKTTLMLTLAYEKGWNIYVDNIKTNYYELFDTFIGVDLEKGEHTIELYYKQPGLKTGLIISIISFITLLTYMIINKNGIYFRVR